MIAGAISLLAAGCSGASSSEQSDGADSSRHPLPDTLRVATLYSPTSFSSIVSSAWATITTF